MISLDTICKIIACIVSILNYIHTVKKDRKDK